MEEAQLKLVGKYTFTIRDAESGEVKRVQEYFNLIPTVARTMLADQLVSSSPTNNPKINYTALGSGTTAPANTDTTLETEDYRKVIASLTKANNIVHASAFYDATEVDGTFKEAGVFCDATAAADSGVLLSRVAIDVTKSNTETLTVDYVITIS